MGWKKRVAALAGAIGLLAALPITASAAPPPWDGQLEVGAGSESAFAPALASCGHSGTAILVWKRTFDHRMAYRIYSISRRTWGPEQVLGGHGGTSEAPSVACGHFGYYVAWKGAGNDTGIYYTTSSDGVSWADQRLVGGDASTYARPSIAVTSFVYGDVQVAEVIHVAWKRTADDPRIYFTKKHTGPGTGAWTATAPVAGGDSRYFTIAPPILSYEFGANNGFDSAPGLLWTGSDNRVRYAALRADGGAAAPTAVAGGNTNTVFPPGAAPDSNNARGSAPGDGTVLWKVPGLDGGSIWYREPGSGDQPTRIPPIGGASQTPAFAYLQLRLFENSKRGELLAWKGSGGDTRLFFSYRDRTSG